MSFATVRPVPVANIIDTTSYGGRQNRMSNPLTKLYLQHCRPLGQLKCPIRVPVHHSPISISLFSSIYKYWPLPLLSRQNTPLCGRLRCTANLGTDRCKELLNCSTYSHSHGLFGCVKGNLEPPVPQAAEIVDDKGTRHLTPGHLTRMTLEVTPFPLPPSADAEMLKDFGRYVITACDKTRS